MRIYCVPETGKYNLRESYLARTFLQGSTYYIPGPTSSTSYTTAKC